MLTSDKYWSCLCARRCVIFLKKRQRLLGYSAPVGLRPSLPPPQWSSRTVEFPTAASCQPGWQTNLWKSKYVYHTDFLCPILNTEGLSGFPESDLHRTEAMMINTCSHAHSSSYSHGRPRFVWFQDKMQKKEPLCEGVFPPRSKREIQCGPARVSQTAGDAQRDEHVPRVVSLKPPDTQQLPIATSPPLTKYEGPLGRKWSEI